MHIIIEYNIVGYTIGQIPTNTIMNVLTVDNIKRIGSQVQPDYDVHPTTIAYVQQLLKPYAAALEPAGLDGIKQWIPLAFPAEVAKHAEEALTKAVDTKTAEFTGDLTPEMQLALDVVAKETVIDYLVADLLEMAGKATREKGDHTMLPWDLKRGIAGDKELSTLFGITPEMKQLPVTVIVGAQKFTHELTEELAMGLLLFSDASVGKTDFNITMFDVPFTTEYIVAPETRFQTEDGAYKKDFSVIVGGKSYGFNTPDFMQGFATGAKWANVDHRAYWKDLTQYKYGDNEEVTETKIAF